jgi:hypothetical protein
MGLFAHGPAPGLLVTLQVSILYLHPQHTSFQAPLNSESQHVYRRGWQARTLTTLLDVGVMTFVQPHRYRCT